MSCIKSLTSRTWSSLDYEEFLLRFLRRARRERKPRGENGRVNSWGREARERRDYRLSLRVWIVRCSHNAKIWLAYARGVDNKLSSFKIRVTSCRNVNLALWKYNCRTRAYQSVGIATHRPWCSCDSANMLYKELNLSSVFMAKLLTSNLKASLSVLSRLINTRLTASPENDGSLSRDVITFKNPKLKSHQA